MNKDYYSSQLQQALTEAESRSYNQALEFVYPEVIVLSMFRLFSFLLKDKQADANFVENALLDLAFYREDGHSGLTLHFPGKAFSARPTMHPDSEEILSKAEDLARCANHPFVLMVNVLEAVHSTDAGKPIEYALKKLGISLSDLITTSAPGTWLPPLDFMKDLKYSGPSDAFIDSLEQKPKKKDLVWQMDGLEDSDKRRLEKVITNLSWLAHKSKIQKIIGRKQEMEDVIKYLCHRKKSTPALVGEPGVGKTIIVENVAAELYAHNMHLIDSTFPDSSIRIPHKLDGYEIWSLNLTALVAGTMYRGEFEDRVQKILKILDSLKVILFVDELHALVTAGGTTTSQGLGNILKPALADNRIRLIGATTYSEFKAHIEKDSALMRRLHKIPVNEPSLEETTQICMGLRGTLAKFYGVEFTKSSVVRAIDIASKYVTEKFFPDKAIDLLDGAGAEKQLKHDGTAVTSHDIEKISSVILNLPMHALRPHKKLEKFQLSDELHKYIFGQDEAINALNRRVLLFKSGFCDKNKPIGSFIFVGPTGTGKSQLTIELAKAMGMKLLRFDMSEYQEPHSVSKLVGSPPGYVGHQDGGVLVEAVRKSPHAVILFDELEKAHPDIYNLLLQVLDYGQLTDTAGRVADFKNTLIIFTTNTGAADAEKNLLGFGDQNNTGEMQSATKLRFPPEFRNRLTGTVTFGKLNVETLNLIYEAQVKQFSTVFRDLHKASFVVSTDLKEKIIKDGHNEKMGARPMSISVEKNIKLPIAEFLSEHAVEKNDVLYLHLRDENVFITKNEEQIDESVHSDL